jgi:hypothetical protein
MRGLILAAVLLSGSGCPGGNIGRKGAAPTADQLSAYLKDLPKRAGSLTAETVSDARIGKDRAKVTVYILVEWGGKLRFVAMSPNGSTAADLASDGTNYCFLDANNNCGDCGASTPEAVGSLLQIVMPPDDIVTLMLGGTPLLPGATAAESWDPKGGHEILDLKSADGLTQHVTLQTHGAGWDVLESEVKTPDGKRLWRVRHKDFHDVKKTDGGGTVRLPGKSFFEQPGNDALIEWKTQDVNKPIDESKFQLALPNGLPSCYQKAQQKQTVSGTTPAP